MLTSIMKKPRLAWIQIAFLFVFFLAFLVNHTEAQGPLDTTEAQVLSDILAIFPILNTAPTPWTGDPVTNGCTWSYVTCDGNTTTQHILKLTLNGATGSHPGHWPPSIGNLTRVTELSIYLRDLEGWPPFPDSIQNMRNLQQLGFSQEYPASTKTQLPLWIGTLPLTSLQAQNAGFSGSSFSAIGNITSLQYLNMIGSFIDGPFPDLRRLTNLISIDWNWMGITGPIPSWINQLTSLERLVCHVNKLNGTIPPEVGLMQKLKEFRLSFNQLTGSIPSSFSQLSGLVELNLQSNQMDGPLPNMSSWTNLQTLNLERNNFSGDVSQSLGGRPPSSACNVNYNGADFICSPDIAICCASYQRHRFDLDGPQAHVLEDILSIFPELNDTRLYGSGAWIGNVSTKGCSWAGVKCSESPTNITDLELAVSTEGFLPTSIGNLSELQTIFFAAPTISKPIPSTLQNCKKLVSIGLSQVNLPSPTPQPWLDWLATLPDLLDLQIQNINFSGSDFSTIAAMNKLLNLNLLNNGLSGDMPDLRNMSSLLALILPANGITGPLPSWISQLTNLRIIWLDDNAITLIPPEISQLKSLHVLLMANNEIEGSFPPITDLPLETLDLSRNNFSGPLPDMTNLTKLTQLYLYDNNFEGNLGTALGSNLANGLITCNANNNNESFICPSEVDSCCSNYIPGQCFGFACTCSTELKSLTRAYIPCANGNLTISGNLSTNATVPFIIGVQDKVFVTELALDPLGTLEIHVNSTADYRTVLNVTDSITLAGTLDIVISSSKMPKEGFSVKVVNGPHRSSFRAIRVSQPREEKKKCVAIGHTAQESQEGFSILLSPTNPCSANNNKVIIGSVVGAVIIITIVIGAALFLYRYMKRRSAKNKGIPIDRILGDRRGPPTKMEQFYSRKPDRTDETSGSSVATDLLS